MKKHCDLSSCFGATKELDSFLARWLILLLRMRPAGNHLNDELAFQSGCIVAKQSARLGVCKADDPTLIEDQDWRERAVEGLEKAQMISVARIYSWP